MAYQTIIYEKKGRIAYVTLNRPEALNAVTAPARLELRNMWQDFKNDDNLWIAIITGVAIGRFALVLM